MHYETIVSQALGFTQMASSFGVSTTQATGATTPVAYPALSFIAPETGTLLTVSLYTQNACTNVKASVYTNDPLTGKPGNCISGSEGPATSTTNSVVNTFNLGTDSEGVSLVAGTRYHLVIKSYTSGQNLAVGYMGTVTQRGSQVVGAGIGHTYISATTADNWGTASTGRFAFIGTMNSGNTFGDVYNYSYSPTPTATNIEMGSEFISPPYWFSISGLSLSLIKSGSPTGDVVLKLRVGGVLRFTSTAFKAEVISSSSGSVSVTTPEILIPPNSTCQITSASNVGDTSSNYIRCNRLLVISGGSTRLPLSAKYITSYDGGNTWSYESDKAAWFCLFGSDRVGSEFVPPPINRRTSTGR